MARQILNPIIGGNFPSRHPEAVRGVGTDVAGAWSTRKQSGRATPRDHRSKKGYTGSVAGVGMAASHWVGRGPPAHYRRGTRPRTGLEPE